MFQEGAPRGAPSGRGLFQAEDCALGFEVSVGSAGCANQGRHAATMLAREQAVRFVFIVLSLILCAEDSGARLLAQDQQR